MVECDVERQIHSEEGLTLETSAYEFVYHP